MDLKERLRGRIPDEKLEHVRTSFDIVGDIAIIKVPDELEDYRDVIADAVMEQHGHVRTVLRKVAERSGEHRTADYEVLKGESTETVYTEHGCRFRLDPTEVYFSERLGHERERVMEQVESGETVIDMFAGIGPFSILIATHRDPAHVHAFELNPDAYGYLEENIALNKVEGIVTAYQGDVAEKLPATGVTADRIIMNLPKQAANFIPLAVDHVRDGGIVHLYRFVAKDDLGEEAAQEVRELFADAGVDAEIAEQEVCGHYNPAVERVCFDVVVEGR